MNVLVKPGLGVYSRITWHEKQQQQQQNLDILDYLHALLHSTPSSSRLYETLWRRSRASEETGFSWSVPGVNKTAATETESSDQLESWSSYCVPFCWCSCVAPQVRASFLRPALATLSTTSNRNQRSVKRVTCVLFPSVHSLQCFTCENEDCKIPTECPSSSNFCKTVSSRKWLILLQRHMFISNVHGCTDSVYIHYMMSEMSGISHSLPSFVAVSANEFSRTCEEFCVPGVNTFCCQEDLCGWREERLASKQRCGFTGRQ